MFATLSYGRGDDDGEIQLLPASLENFGGRRPARLACIECRVKKVKCTGDRSGCTKCVTNGIPCVYPAMSERCRPRRRHNVSSISSNNNSNNTISKTKTSSCSGVSIGSNNSNSGSSGSSSDSITVCSSFQVDPERARSGLDGKSKSDGVAGRPNSRGEVLAPASDLDAVSLSKTALGSSVGTHASNSVDMSDMSNAAPGIVDNLLSSLTPMPLDFDSMPSPSNTSHAGGDNFIFRPDFDGKRGDDTMTGPWPLATDDYTFTFDQLYAQDVLFSDQMDFPNPTASHTPIMAATPPPTLGASDAGSGEGPINKTSEGRSPNSHGDAAEPPYGLTTSTSSCSTTLAAESQAMSSSLRNALVEVAQKQHDQNHSHCSCSMSAVCLLEELVLRDHQDCNLSTDVVLKNLKASLDELRSWLSCERCRTPKAMSMLVALIINRLSIYLEKGVAHYVRKLQRAMKKDKDSYSRVGAVGDYQIESNSEWIRVIGVLLQVKSEELSDMIAHLNERVSPGPPHNWILGHIPILLGLLREVPVRLAPVYYADLIRQKYGLGDVYYFDLWPIGTQSLIIVDPDITNNLLVKKNIPKNSLLKLFMRFLTGSSDNLLSSDGHTWLRLRRIFNPGFAPGHLRTLIPSIVEEARVFGTILEGLAQRQELFRLEDRATLLAIDVIGRAILDVRLNSQVSRNELAGAIINQVEWIPQARHHRPWEILNPMFIFMMWRNNRKMDAYISAILDQRLLAREQSVRNGKNVMDLALEAYVREQNSNSRNAKSSIDTKESSVHLYPQFKQDAICQVKTFMFAGHDTVSGTLCYAYYLLSKNPDKLARLVQEHDDVFTSNIEEAADMIASNPSILNRLDYTVAVLKETLRLFPPASTVREGSKDLLISDPVSGESLPTEGFVVSPTTVGMHRHPKYFPNPHAFIPERFLVTGDDAMRKGSSDSSNPAYLPFSKGPRICIGQEFAMTEMKTILAMTVRKFDIRPAFDELDKLKGGGSYYPNGSKGIQSVYGDEAYPVMLGSAKPREGMPARVALRKM